MNIGISSCDRNKMVIYNYEIENCENVKTDELPDKFEYENFIFSKALNDIECTDLFRYSMVNKDYDSNDIKPPKLSEVPYIKLYKTENQLCGVYIAFSSPYWRKLPYKDGPMYADSTISSISRILNLKIKSKSVEPSYFDSKNAFLKYCDKN